MDMNLQKFLAFVKTVEFGSFTKAAEKLNYSQPGISRMISDLEREWKVVLLERGKAGVRLTPDGKKLLPYARRVCDEYDKLQLEIDALAGLQEGLIRLAAFSGVTENWLPNILREFRRDYPGVDFEILLGSYSEIEEWIVSGRVDCGFLRLPSNADLDSEFLEKDELCVVLPENHPIALSTTEEDIVPLKECMTETFILPGRCAREDVEDLFKEYNYDIHYTFTVLNDATVLAMVEEGLGITILPRMAMERVPRKVALRKLDVPAYRNIGFAVRNRKNAPLAVRRLMEYIQKR